MELLRRGEHLDRQHDCRAMDEIDEQSARDYYLLPSIDRPWPS